MYRMSQQVLDRNLAKTPAGDLAVGDEGYVNSEFSKTSLNVTKSDKNSSNFAYSADITSI